MENFRTQLQPSDYKKPKLCCDSASSYGHVHACYCVS